MFNGVFFIDYLFEYFGGLLLVVCYFDGVSLVLYIVDLCQCQLCIMVVVQFFVSELCGCYFSLQWIVVMQCEGYVGSLEMFDLVNNLWGWQVVDCIMVCVDQWQVLYDIFVMDCCELGFVEWFEMYNLIVQVQIIVCMVEVICKGYWDVSEQICCELVECWW